MPIGKGIRRTYPTFKARQQVCWYRLVQGSQKEIQNPEMHVGATENQTRNT